MSTSVSRSTSIAPNAIIQQTRVLCHPDEGVTQASSLVTVASPDDPAASMDTIVSYQARPPAPTLTVRVRCPSRVSATAHPCADGDLRGLAVTARETLAEGASLSRSQPWRQDCSGDCGDVRGPVHPCRVFPVRAPRAATGVPPDSARTFSETDVGFSAWPEGYPQFTSTALPPDQPPKGTRDVQGRASRTEPGERTPPVRSRALSCSAAVQCYRPGRRFRTPRRLGADPRTARPRQGAYDDAGAAELSWVAISSSRSRWA